MSLIDFYGNNYEARRILLDNILLEHKDKIVLENHHSTYGNPDAAPYKFTFKIDRYRIDGYVGYKKDEVQYLLVQVYHMSWLGLLSDYRGSCVFSWEYPASDLPEDMEQLKTYLRCVLKNKVYIKIGEDARKAEKARKKELEKERKATAEFMNYFKRSCTTSE